jgi:hypothetical protein
MKFSQGELGRSGGGLRQWLWRMRIAPSKWRGQSGEKGGEKMSALHGRRSFVVVVEKSDAADPIMAGVTRAVTVVLFPKKIRDDFAGTRGVAR